ncbi:MAG: PilZ domain-containing protein [Sulfuricurvum sp.]
MAEIRYTSFSALKSLFHPRFTIQNFEGYFVKAGIKVFLDLGKRNATAEEMQEALTQLFHAMFSGQNQEIADALDGMHRYFDSPNAIGVFLSDTFYLVLNQYVRSYYGSIDGWGKVTEFASAIHAFVKQASSQIYDEALYIFEDTIINIMEEMRQNQRTVTVLNTYLGIPIQYPARIIHTDTHGVVIKAHAMQEWVALFQKGIYILKNGYVANDVFAHVKPVKLKGERYLRLTRFDKLETSLFHRQNVRVQPDLSYTVTITYQSNNSQAKMYDLSLGGIALITATYFPIPLEAEVALAFPQALIGEKKYVRAKLVYKSAYENGHKLHFKMELTPQQEGELSRYIRQREQEIIKDLREKIS